MEDTHAQAVSRRHAGRHAPSLSFQAIAFAVVGLSGTALTFVLLTLLHKGLGWQIWLANPPAYAAGIVNNYFWNRHWTFRHTPRKKVLHQGGQFALVSIGGLVINTLVLAAFVHASKALYLEGFAVAALVSYGWNFSINHRITFRHHARVPVVIPNEGD